MNYSLKYIIRLSIGQTAMEETDFLIGKTVFTPSSTISAISFSLMSPQDVKALSNVTITSADQFHQSTPVDGGIYDAHMGTTSELWDCDTCLNDNAWCPGHEGDIELNYPVPNPLCLEYIARWLRIICWTCGQLISQQDPPAKMDNMLKMQFYLTCSRGIRVCPKCSAPTWLAKQRKPEYPLSFAKTLVSAEKKASKYSRPNDMYEHLYNHTILAIFRKVTTETVTKLGMPSSSHPANLMITNLCATANTIRPEVKTTSKKVGPNDITALLKMIVTNNEYIKLPLPPDERVDSKTESTYYALSLAVKTMIKGAGTSKKEKVSFTANTNRDFTSLAARQSKKSGHWRHAICGKRAHRIVRSVITGDNNIPIDAIGVPIITARTIQIWDTVTKYNKQILTQYLKNGRQKYPGCSNIIRSDTGAESGIEGLPQDYTLQEGDILLRDLIDGDRIGFNRQPSLSFSSIAGYRVFILHYGNTLRMNVSACNWHHADFDGDCMAGIIAQTTMPIVEIQYITSVKHFVISYQDAKTMIGTYQDSLINTALLSSATTPKITRAKAMQMFANIDELGPGNLLATWNFDKEFWTGRELITKCLPAINLISKPQFYDSKFVPYLKGKYHPEDIKVEIVNGELKSGVLDNETFGQGNKGGIVHITHNDFGPNTALQLIFTMHLLSTKFHLYRGYSVSAADITLPDEIKSEMTSNIAKVVADSYEITRQLHSNELRPPTGTSLKTFYYDQQFNAFQPADDFLYPALRMVDLYYNYMWMLMSTGSKGKPRSNFAALVGMIGRQDINGAMPESDVGIARTSPYFLNNDPNPESMGLVTQSFYNGIHGRVYLSCAQEARNGLVTQALATAKSGVENRAAIKSFEGIILDPSLRCVQSGKVTQSLYAGTGFDPRRLESVKFPTVSSSEEEFAREYRCTKEHIDKKFNTPKIISLLDAEFEQLSADRQSYRRIGLCIEGMSAVKLIRFSNSRELPVNIPRIIKNVRNANGESTAVVDPVSSINAVNKLCSGMPYLYTNQMWETAQKFIPEQYRRACTLTQIAIRSYLCTRELIRSGIDDKQLQIIIQNIRVAFKKALMDYGMCTGILSAQCFSEPLTQFILNSKHRSGAGGGTKTTAIVRVNEILGAKHTSNMLNPTMRIFLLPEYETSKEKVREIATYIETVTVGDIINTVHVFYEEFGTPKYPRFSHESKMIAEFVKRTGSKPRNLTNYCIRLEFSRESLVLKSLRFRTILSSIQQAYPDLFQIHSAENSPSVVLRLYPTLSSFSKQSKKTMYEQILQMVDSIKKHYIRGVKGIISTQIVEVMRSVIKEDGSVGSEMKQIYAIDTDGSNLEDILDNPFVDPYRTQTDSIMEMAEMYGIECARAKIISELSTLMDATSAAHLTVYADVMTSTGIITSVERAGTAHRNRTNVTQRASYGAPIQVLREAAIYGYTNKINDVTGALATGTVPQVGTTYHNVTINTKFVEEAYKISETQLDEL